ncbi:DoxX family protein [Lacinutrix chionoecetis]
MKNKKQAYALTRIIVGVSMFGHGLVRLPKITEFSNGMVKKFSDSMVPELLVSPFGYALTIAEFALGILLIIGLFSKQTLLASIITMILLVFGSTMIENWSVINSQLIHATIFAFLLWFLDYNYWALDNVIKKSKS